MSLLLSFALLTAVSLALTGAVRRYALSRSLIDIPNARSSHSAPTPRGGGVAIVVTFLLTLLFVGLMDQMAWAVVIALAGAGMLVAITGFLDDHGHIAARWRLAAHFLSAGWLLAWLPELPGIALFGVVYDLSVAGYVLAGLFLVWLLNLYNFMDGIDGIASVEAITTGLGGALLYWLIGENSQAIMPMLLAAAVAGFLFWNFPPARIFMGDAGSGFLGIVLGGLVLQAALVHPPLLWGWLILLGIFIVDATYTLFRRVLRGEKVYEAHRSHAYQYASRQYGAHKPVTLAVTLINLFWLLPWACLVSISYVDGFMALLIAYLPLLFLAVCFHAGKQEVMQ